LNFTAGDLEHSFTHFSIPEITGMYKICIFTFEVSSSSSRKWRIVAAMGPSQSGGRFCEQR
jgi:hypothetical protein